MSPDFEYAVVGAGAVGSAAAYHLAKEGHSVALFEQFDIGHERGSSHGHSRIYRLSYTHPTYVDMAYAAQSLWRQLEEEAGVQLLKTTGGLDMGMESNSVFRSCMTSMDKNSIPYERLCAADIRKRFPQFNVSDDMMGIFQAEAGILDASLCVKTMVEQAARHGALVKPNCPVVVIEPGETTRIIAEEADFTCKKVIVSAGAWSQALLEPLGIFLPLRITKEQYLFFVSKNLDLFKGGPIFVEYGALRHSQDINMYGFPVFEMDAVKVASHQTGPTTTANMRTFEIEEEIAQEVKDYVKKRLPQLMDENIIDAKTCLYTNTPDEDFIIDVPAHCQQVTVASACSGHGFKFAVLTGRMACELATKGKTDRRSDLFSLSRFLGQPV